MASLAQNPRRLTTQNNHDRLFFPLAGLLLLTCLGFGCGDDSEPPTTVPNADPEWAWTSLGFESHWAIQLELDWPYLYACAADEGLFRMNLQQDGGQWEYVGLADTSLSSVPFGRRSNRGVQDVAILDDRTLIAAVKSGIPHFPGLYRSVDDGEIWLASDQGVADSSAPYASSMVAVEVVPCEENTVVAAGHAIYRSENGGLIWSLVNGRRDGNAMYRDLQLHPADGGNAWAGGESVIFAGFLFTSEDAGNSWRRTGLTYADLGDNAVYSLAPDPFNPLGAIVCMSRSAIRSFDGGETWQDPAFDWAPNGRLWNVIFDSGNQGHFFASYGKGIFESWNDGASADTLETPNTSTVVDLEYDADGNALYVGTWAGVFRYGVVTDR